MEQSRQEPNSRSDGQEIPHRLFNPKVHYRVHKSLPLDPILQMNPPHTLEPYVFIIHYNIVPSACVKELGRTNRKEKVIERVLRY
jgi:hypothetical protein